MASAVYVRRNGSRTTLGNTMVDRTIVIEDGVLRTVAVGRLEIESEEFRLALADGRERTSRDFRALRWSELAAAGPGQAIGVELEERSGPLRARVVYELGPEDFWLRKTIFFRSLGADMQVNWLDVESFRCEASVRLGGRGQPLYLDEAFFLGLEYPAGFNEVRQGRVGLRHYPSWIRSAEEMRSKTAVWGVAPAGEAGAWFARYIARSRRRNRSFVTFNSGADVQIYEPVATPDLTERVEDRLRRCAERLKENLVDRGVTIRSFVLDAGWQDPQTLYEVDRAKFPNGFGPLLERLRAMGANLGLWLSLSTPLSPQQLDRKFLEAEGYGMEPGGRYPCLSEPRYNRALRAILKKHIVEHGVVHLKLDFNNFRCTAATHGHLPDEVHSFETNLDAHIELLQYMASLREDIIIDPTCGMWLSPWWLLHADMIWPHGMWDFNYCRTVVALEPRDWAITYRDQNLYQLLRQEQCQFPLSGITFCACLGGPRYNIAGPLEKPRKLTDAVVHAYARQLDLRRKELSSPMTRHPVEWEVFRGALAWALDRGDQAAEGRLVLGEPAAGQVYGYSRLTEAGGVLSLRNPAAHGQTGVLPLEGLAPGRDYLIEVTYPYRQVLGAPARSDTAVSLALGPHEVAIVEATPISEAARPIVEGVRYSLVTDEPGLLEADLWTAPGEAAVLRLRGPAGGTIVAAEVDGRPIGLGTAGMARVELAPVGRPEAVRIKPLSRLKDKDGGMRNAVRVDVPASEEALLVLVARETVVRSAVIAVNMGGWFGGLPYRVTVGEGWVAYSVRLDPQDLNAITWRLTEDDERLGPPQTLWLLMERRLTARRLKVVYRGPGKPRRPELPTPFAGLRVQAVQIYPLPGGAGEAMDGREWIQEFVDEYK